MADNDKKTAPAAAVPDGHVRIRWVYNPDPAVINTVEDLPADRVRVLKAENRVALVDPSTPLSGPLASGPTE